MNTEQLTPMSRKIYELILAEGVGERDMSMVVRNCCQNIVSATSSTIDVDKAQLDVLRTIVWFNAERRSATFNEWGTRFSIFMNMRKHVKLDDVHTLMNELNAIDELLNERSTVNVTVHNRSRGPSFFYAGNTDLQPRVVKPGDKSRARVVVHEPVMAKHELLIDLKSFVRDLQRACTEAVYKRVGVTLEVNNDAKAGEGRRFGKDKLPAWSSSWDHNNRI